MQKRTTPNILKHTIALVVLWAGGGWLLPMVAQTTERTPDVPKIEYTNTVHTYEIADIVITGTDNYEDYVLIGFSGLSVGDKIQVPGSQITSAVKRFWKQGMFSSVKILATKIENGKVWLEINLRQRPRISAITYNGVKKSEREDLEEQVGISQGNQLTPNLIDNTKQKVQKYYAEKGFYNARVDVRQQDDPEKQGFVLVDVNVNKGEKTRVNAIYINGNEALTHNKINRVMKKTNDNHILNFFRTKKFVAKEYENDKVALIEKYNEIGYRDARIVADSIVPSPVENKVDVYITVDEGKKYYFRNITWIGNTVYPYEYLDAVLGIKKGDVYNLKELNNRLMVDDDAVSKLYSDQGYLFFNIDPVETNVSGDSIDFEMRMYEGKPATINAINITGNTRVYEHVIRRELDTKPGQLYSQSDIMRSLRELANMGHFDQEKLIPDIQPNPEDGTVDITYQLETKSSDKVELQFGWGSTGLVGSIGLTFTNFAIQNLFKPKTYHIVPQGEGQTFSLAVRTNGRYYTSANISFLEPWLGGKRPNSLSVSAYFASQSDMSRRYYESYSNLNNYYNSLYGYGNGYYGYGNGYYGNNYNDYLQYQQATEVDPGTYLRTFGAAVGYGMRLTWPDDYFTFYGELSYRLYMMKNWRYLLFSNGVSHDFSLSLTLSRSSIDNPIYTRRGSSFTLGLKITPPYSLINGKDYSPAAMTDAQRYKFLEYHKWKFSAKTFTPLSRDNKLVLMARAEFGYLGHYNENARSPFETYYFGGDGMTSYTSYSTEYVAMRGYESGSLTPYDSRTGWQMGYLYNKFTMELRYPITLEQSATIWALAFVEAGNCFASIKDYNPFNLKRSAGVGVRIFLPMFGLLGIDWAYGFDKVGDSMDYSGSQFHFVLGQEL